MNDTVMSPAEWHNWDEYIADQDIVGSTDEDEVCQDDYDGDDYSEGLE